MHVNKPMPNGISITDNLLELVLAELRGLRDDLDARALPVAPPTVAQVEDWAEPPARAVEVPPKPAAPPANLVELREPAPPAVKAPPAPPAERPLDALAGPKRPKKAT